MQQRSSSPRIAVIGGGISGLAAAHRLVELAPESYVVLFESRDRLGGSLHTIHEDGFQVEQGVDNFITTLPWGVALCRRLGLVDELVQTNPTHRKTFVVRGGRLHRLPDGFLMMAPTRMWPLAVTPILSPLGKMRAAMEYFIPPATSDDDESMANFVRRRLGNEVYQRLVEPLVSAVYAADLEKLSVNATLSRFRDMEREHGSLIRAMRRQMAERRRSARDSSDGQSGARYSMFVALRRGLSSLVDAIAQKLGPGRIRVGTAVTELAQNGPTWTVATENGNRQEFDGIIFAAPSHVAAEILAPHDQPLAQLLGQITHSGTAILTLGFRREQIAHPLSGMGAVVPAIENSPILACSFSSQKYPHRAPEGTELLRVFVGGSRRPEMAFLPQEEIEPVILKELDHLLGIRGEPIYSRVAHWPNTMPQYHVGHRQLVAEIEQRVAGLERLELAGNAYRGVGIPDCIHGAESAAERLLAGISPEQRSGPSPTVDEEHGA